MMTARLYGGPADGKTADADLLEVHIPAELDGPLYVAAESPPPATLELPRHIYRRRRVWVDCGVFGHLPHTRFIYEGKA